MFEEQELGTQQADALRAVLGQTLSISHRPDVTDQLYPSAICGDCWNVA